MVTIYRGFVLDIGFIDHLSTQLVTTSNYSAIADFYTLIAVHTHTHTHTHTSVLGRLLDVSRQRLLTGDILLPPGSISLSIAAPFQLPDSLKLIYDHFTPTPYSSLHSSTFNWALNSLNESESCVTTDSQSASLMLLPTVSRPVLCYYQQ
jgi:hypothetical protein